LSGRYFTVSDANTGAKQFAVVVVVVAVVIVAENFCCMMIGR